MDLDLLTNSTAITNSINSLNGGKISWIVLGYINNKTIQVVETGNDSLEDMFEEFDGSKIMYGFAAVTDPNSKLKKNVFIYWQGEAASQSMKTISVKHANIIRDLCKPIHVTHNARDEQDLELKEIMTKVASASGSNYSCHTETKQIYHQPSLVKSEENNASNLRQNRLKELSALGSIQKDTVQDQHVGSNYEKVDAMKEIKNLRTKTFDESPPSKPTAAKSTKVDVVKEKAPYNSAVKPVPSYKVGTNYTKIDASKEIKSCHSNVSSHQNVGTNYTKIDASKEIKSFNNSEPVIQNVVPAYKKINPEQELKSSILNQKIMFENKAKVQSENNTAQKVKEEREKELTSIFNKKSVCDSTFDDSDRHVGTNYTKVNPIAEIKKLRSASITQNDDVFSAPSSNYKKIDPNAEIKSMRRSSSSETSEPPLSPKSSYNKINPAEELKKLRSQSTFSDERSFNKGYKKIDATEEINSARRLSTPFVKPESTSKDTTVSSPSPSIDVKRNSLLSARQTFENAHTTNSNVHQPHKFPVIKKELISEPKKIHNHPNSINIDKVENIKTPPAVVQQVPVVVEKEKTSFSTSKEIVHENTSMKNTAKAQFMYEATDGDEISFEEGEIIREIEIVDNDWWIGNNAAGKRGMFPSNYVMPYESKENRANISEPNNAKETHKSSEKQTNISVPSSIVLQTPAQVEDKVCVVAIFDYVANDDDEISFNCGEMIKEVENIDDGWWIGFNAAGKKGMFPSNFVEIHNIKQDVNLNLVVPNTTHDCFTASRTVKALFDYSGQDDDELSFNTGDIISNVMEIDDGWWEGDSVDGKRGLFPSNYVESI